MEVIAKTRTWSSTQTSWSAGAQGTNALLPLAGRLLLASLEAAMTCSSCFAPNHKGALPKKGCHFKMRMDATTRREWIRRQVQAHTRKHATEAVRHNQVPTV